MDHINGLIDRYFAAWNETDAGRRRELIAQVWADNARYVDPLVESVGHDGINTMIAGVQDQFAGLQFRGIGNIDAHHDCVRFAWELAPAGGAAVASGTDVGIVTADGKLQTVTGFLDSMPTS